MKRVRRKPMVAILVAQAIFGLVSLVACANMAEGDRCEVLNGNDDCQSGLVCLPAGQVNQPYNNSDRCCPVDRSTATHPACTLLSNPVAGDAAPPGDSGPAIDSGVDAGGDAQSDAADASDAADDVADASEAG